MNSAYMRSLPPARNGASGPRSRGVRRKNEVDALINEGRQRNCRDRPQAEVLECAGRQEEEGETGRGARIGTSRRRNNNWQSGGWHDHARLRREMSKSKHYSTRDDSG